jgi:ubiquitin-like protein Pup
MPQQVHVRISQPGSDASTRTVNDDEIDQAVADAQERARAAETLDATDDLLDEIDAILTEEEEFAMHYLQKGGE